MQHLLDGEFQIFAPDCSQSTAIRWHEEKGAPLAFVVPSDFPLIALPIGGLLIGSLNSLLLGLLGDGFLAYQALQESLAGG